MSTLDLRGPIPRGRVLLEASAGTGKTYALTALIVRSLAEGLVDVDGLLVVTFTRSATREITDRVRAGIDEARAALRRPDDTAPDWLEPLLAGSADDRATCLGRLEAASMDLDRASVTTIHGFCKVALRHLGAHGGLTDDIELDGGSSVVRRQVVRDALLAELINDPEALTPGADQRKKTTDLDPGGIEAKFDDIVKGILQNRGAETSPDPTWPDAANLSDGARRWGALAHSMAAEVIARRHRAGTMDFDDLVDVLDRALRDPDHGTGATRRLRERFRMVYIDEFQDTDAVQWRVFERAFLEEPPDDPTSLGDPSDVTVVGDPKQAIYRFRGADIDAYLDAARATEAHGTRLHLGTNHRSDGDLVEALNVLYRGATFGSPEIAHHPVSASTANPARACGLPPVAIRWMRPDLKADGTYGKTIDKTLSDAAILTDLANEVGRMLAGATITTDGSPRQVRAGDISILVSAHTEAEAVVQVLRDRDIPVIRTRVGSVLRSTAARDLHLLLRGMRRPSDLRAVRGAAVSFFVGASTDDLTDDDSLVGLQDRLANWAEVSIRDGLPSLLQDLRADPDVLSGLLADGDGPRHLTDLEHLVELLHVECEGRPATPANALRALGDLMAEASADGEVVGDEVLRRIATDAACVQVSTVHAAKGLEYPIVLLPFAAKSKNNNRPWSYRAGDRRFLDAAPNHEWAIDDPAHDLREEVAKGEVHGDAQRLLYVAFTRARHRVVAWWRPISGVDNAGLTRILFGARDEAGAVDTSRPATRPPADEYADQFDDLEALAGDRLEISELHQGVEPDMPAPVAAPPSPSTAVATVDTSTFSDDDWRTWSFSAIAADRRLEDTPPSTGGTDEPVVHDDGPLQPSTGLTDMPAGRDVGTFLHEVLEHLDFQSPTIHRDLVTRLDGAWQLAGADAGSIADGLIEALGTPLVSVTETRLVDVGRADRLDELAFDLRLSDGRRRVAVADLCRTIPDADPDDPYAGYFTELAHRTTAVEAGGHLVGSIDLVLRIPGETGALGPRFLVVDHKSNRLHHPADPDWSHHYGQAPMRTAMAHHDYPLQALLYTVALHRYLRWRLANRYDPSSHLAGSAYLFLRGMTGAVDPEGCAQGVSWWRPPTEAVMACDRLLAGRP